MVFTLPPLPYAYDALQPYMSRETLEYHHDKHHQAYIDNLNKLMVELGVQDKSLPDIVKNSPSKSPLLLNNAGQHYNHIHFWNCMKQGGGGTSLPHALGKAISEQLGGYAQFRASFIQAGLAQFGSGWCWLALKENKLIIMKTPNGESPLLQGAEPLLACDVWEHSYYIDYRNRRADYLAAFVDNLINWDYVEETYRKVAL